MSKILIKTNKYNGKYVAMASINDNTIVGTGRTPEEALNEAKKNQIREPFLLYVPDKNSVHIYYVS